MTEYEQGSGAPSGPRATFWARFVAALIDGILVGIVGGGFTLFGDSTGGGIGTVLGLAYHTFFEGSPSGQTLGKRAMNIRVLDFNTGESIGYGRAVVRYIGRILSSIVCLLGFLWMLWDPEKQTWHDKLANSVVVPTSSYPVAAWPG